MGELSLSFACFSVATMALAPGPVFVHAGPLPLEQTFAPMNCSTYLHHYCGHSQAARAECEKCLEHYHKGVTEHCTKSQEEAFCGGGPNPPPPGPPSPSKGNCKVVLEKECGKDEANTTKCEKCVQQNFMKVLAANCTEQDVEGFCHVKPGPSPPPSPPATTCKELLMKDCGKDQANMTECESCVERNTKALLAAKCTERDVVYFCHAQPGPSPPPAPPGPGPSPSPSSGHYEDPKNGCRPDEQDTTITGIPGDFCSPSCSQTVPCPTDVPAGTTATPQCVLEKQGTSNPTNCALVCGGTSPGQCPPGATCQSIQNTGICTYPKTNFASSVSDVVF